MSAPIKIHSVSAGFIFWMFLKTSLKNINEYVYQCTLKAQTNHCIILKGRITRNCEVRQRFKGIHKYNNLTK